MKYRLAALLLTVILLLCGCIEKVKTDKKTAVYFDTVVTLTTFNGSVPSDAIRLCEKYDRLLSVTDSESDIYKLNSSDGSVTVDPDTARLIKNALSYCEKTDGALDITIYPVKKLWGFGTDTEKVPTTDELTTALKNVDYCRVKIDGNTVSVPSGVQIDLGAIAKGFIADELAKLYRENGISGIIDLGGNILTVGEKSDGEDYTIGIVSPQNTDKNAARLRFSGGAAVTSGSYQRYFQNNGKKYHHILSADSGYPVENGVASVTVIAESAEKADAYSTALFCMGAERAVEFCRKQGDIEAVIIADDGGITLSDGLAQSGDLITLKNG